MNALAIRPLTTPTAIADRAALTRAIEIVENVVERRYTYPILANVRLRGDGDRLFLTGTDLDIVIDVAVTAPADSEFDVTLPAAMLKQLLKGAPKAADMVAMTAPPVVQSTVNGATVTDFDGPAVIDFDSVKYTVAGIHPEGWPELKCDGFSHQFTIAGAELFAALDGVKFAISKEETRYYLNGIYVHCLTPSGHNRPELRFVATDGHRLARQEITAPDGTVDMPGAIVPAKTVELLLKLTKGKNCPETIAVEVSKDRLRFHFDGVTVTSKTVDGTFPDYERVTPKNNDKRATFNAERILEGIKAVSLVASDRGGKAVKIQLEKSNCTLSVTNPNSGTAETSFRVETDFEGAFEIGFNARYLSEIIGEAGGDAVTFAFNDAGSPTLVAGGREGWTGVLMPMRV